MAEAYAQVSDYTARTAGPTLTDVQRDQVAALLVDASAIIRNAPGRTVTDTDVLRAICVAMVKRTVTNPGGLRQRTIGGYSETLTDSGGLYLSDAELTQLAPPSQDDTDTALNVQVRLPHHHRGGGPWEGDLEYGGRC